MKRLEELHAVQEDQYLVVAAAANVEPRPPLRGRHAGQPRKNTEEIITQLGQALELWTVERRTSGRLGLRGEATGGHDDLLESYRDGVDLEGNLCDRAGSDQHWR